MSHPFHCARSQRDLVSGSVGVTDVIVTGEVADLTPLSAWPDLRSLAIEAAQVNDLTPLAGCPRLQTLSIYGTPIRDFSVLSALHDLTRLSIDIGPTSVLPERLPRSLREVTLDTRGGDLTCIRTLDTPTRLTLSGGRVEESWLEPFTSLERLVLTRTTVRRLDFVQAMDALVDLWVTEGQLATLSPLTGRTQLRRLRLSFNRIEDLNPLRGLVQLERLDIDANRIRDLSPLADLPRLQSLRVQGNPLERRTPLLACESLQHVWVDERDAHRLRSRGPSFRVHGVRSVGE